MQDKLQSACNPLEPGTKVGDEIRKIFKELAELKILKELSAIGAAIGAELSTFCTMSDGMSTFLHHVGWEVETIRLATIILYTMTFTFPQPRNSVRSFPSTLYGGSGGRKLPPRSWKR